MNNQLFQTELPFWWIIPAVIIAAGISYFLYTKKNEPWGRNLSIVLGTIRAIVIIVIIWLFLNPFLNRQTNFFIDPRVPIVIDNSSSVTNDHDSTEILNFHDQIKEAIQKKDYDIITHDLSGIQNSISFSYPFTDLVNAIEKAESSIGNIKNDAVILISDGLNNRGFSPVFKEFSSPLYILGLGDTTQKNDVAITNVRYNEIVYQGNKFPIEITISKLGNQSINSTLEILNKQSVVYSEELKIDSDRQIEVFLDASKPGLNSFNIRLKPGENDQVKTNNSYQFYVDIIEDQQKILILAASPHPDIRTLRESLEKTENYSTELYIPGISKTEPYDNYDLIIAHNPGDRNFPSLELENDPPIWYIVDANYFSNQISVETGITVSGQGKKADAVRPGYNTDFSRFKLKQDNINSFNTYPTIDAPYGEYSINGPVDVLLYQKIGNVRTARPLLSFFDDGSTKRALLFGTGIWKWKLQEAAIEGNSDNFDDLVRKTVQYLCIRTDKKIFRAEPSKRSFNFGEQTTFSIETYNDIYERTSGNEVNIVLSSDESTQSFSFNSESFRNSYPLGVLEPGIYNYQANTRISGKNYQEKGEFLVKNTQLESNISQANHTLLKTMASNSGGNYFHFNDIDGLLDEISQLDLSGKIETEEQFLPLINLFWIMIVLIVWLSIEWFLRKYLGSY